MIGASLDAKAGVIARHTRALTERKALTEGADA